MAMNYEELDDATRKSMLEEFEKEQQLPTRYQSKALSPFGLSAFPDLMRAAIKAGNEEVLAKDLAQPAYWTPQEEYTRNGITRLRKRNIDQSANRLATTEFSTWYVRGFAARLITEGEVDCEIYRAAQPKWEPGDCAEHEGKIAPVEIIYENHRSRYWPEPGDSTRFSIPFSPGCHHVIRRVNRRH